MSKKENLVKINQKIQNLLEQSIQSIGELSSGELRKAVVLMTAAKCLKTHKSVMILINNGHGQDALALDRILVEYVINLKFLLENWDDYQEKFIYHTFLIKQGLLEVLEEAGFDPPIPGEKEEIADEIKENAEKAEDLGLDKRNPSWSGVSNYKMAEAVGMENLYLIPFFYCCQVVHFGAVGIDKHIEFQKDKFSLDIGPSDNEIEPALRIAFQGAANILETLSEEFALELNEQISDLIEGYKKIGS